MTSFLIAGMLAIIMCGSVKPLASQTQPTTVERKVVTRLEPEYPETLKRLYIGGVVRVEVIVNANGAVQTTELLGGNPILGQSAMKAIKQWKYAPAAGKEKLVVQLEFDPHR
jgi:TonB family protein